MKYKILVMEDDKGINSLISFHLKEQGYDVISVFDGDEAIKQFDNSIHLAILDIMVPKKDGFTVLEELRKEQTIPVLFLTAMTSEIDKLRALGLGADDYVTKPFSIMEVIYRVNALLRRAYSYANLSQSEQILIGEIKADLTKGEIFLNEEVLVLSAKEFELLVCFMKNPGKIFTKKQLYEKIWGEEYYGDDNTIMVHISRLRDKLKDKSKTPKYIKTIKGLGYRMEKVDEE